MAKHSFDLKPFTVPNFAAVELPPTPRQEGIKELPSLPLADLSQEALDDLVADWIVAVYEKAGKRSQWSMPLPNKAAMKK